MFESQPRWGSAASVHRYIEDLEMKAPVKFVAATGLMIAGSLTCAINEWRCVRLHAVIPHRFGPYRDFPA